MISRGKTENFCAAGAKILGFLHPLEGISFQNGPEKGPSWPTPSDPPSFSELGAEILDSGDLEGSGLGRLRRPEKIVFLVISRGILAKNPPPAAENVAFWSPDFGDF